VGLQSGRSPRDRKPPRTPGQESRADRALRVTLESGLGGLQTGPVAQLGEVEGAGCGWPLGWPPAAGSAQWWFAMTTRNRRQAIERAPRPAAGRSHFCRFKQIAQRQLQRRAKAAKRLERPWSGAGAAQPLVGMADWWPRAGLIRF